MFSSWTSHSPPSTPRPAISSTTNSSASGARPDAPSCSSLTTSVKPFDSVIALSYSPSARVGSRATFPFPCPARAAWKIPRSPSPPAKFWMNSAKKSTAPSKPNTRKAPSRISNRGWKHETRSPLHHLLFRNPCSLGDSRQTENLASVSFPHSVGRGRGTLRRLPGSHVPDRHLGEHAASADRLRHLRGPRHDPRPRRSEQQISRRNHGRPAGQPAELA